MKILVGCERSGVVRDKLRELNHDAWSCDILPSEESNDYHIEGDVRKYLYEGWDMAIFFPDCTHICVSGARYFSQKTELQETALDFVARLMVAPISKIAIENPVGVISTKIRKPDQIIQPWMFGDDASKKTCLWLKNLPKLEPTNIIKKDRYENQTVSGQNKLAPSKDRAYLRAKTYPGIADAMAQQWTNPLYSGVQS